MSEQTELGWIAVARSYIGTLEIKGDKDNPVIVEMFKSAGHSWVRDDETAWCAAFVGDCLFRVKLPNTKSLAARSYENYGTRLPGPIYGCIGVKQRAGGAAWQGHVGFVVGATKDKIFLLGGNQGDKVSIAAFPKKDFTAFVYPAGVPVPQNPRPLPDTVEGAAGLGGSEA